MANLQPSETNEWPEIEASTADIEAREAHSVQETEKSRKKKKKKAKNHPEKEKKQEELPPHSPDFPPPSKVSSVSVPPPSSTEPPVSFNPPPPKKSAPQLLPPVKVTPSSNQQRLETTMKPTSTAMMGNKATRSSSFMLLKHRKINANIRKSIYKTATKERSVKRFTWKTNFDFCLVSLACVIGIDNLIVFPQKCKQYGGLAFFVPYMIVSLTMGLPLYFLETLLGQYSGHGTVAVMNELVPAFVGIGYALIINNFVEFMRAELGVTRIFYLALTSLKSTIPWTTCGETNTIGCHTRLDDLYCADHYSVNSVFFNKTCTHVSVICASLFNASSTGKYCYLKNHSMVRYDRLITRLTPEREFLSREILNLDGASLDHLGPIHWPMLGCLAFCWAMTYVMGYSGFATTAKSAYLTIFAPLFCQCILYGKAFFLTGAVSGMKAYLRFDASILASKEVWIDAIKLNFDSLSLGLGLVTALGSVSKPYKNCLKTSVVVIITDTVVSLICGLGFFALMGHLAFQYKTPVEVLLAQEKDVVRYTLLPMVLSTLEYPRVYVALAYASTVLISYGYLAAVIGMTTFDGKDIFNSLYNPHGDREKSASTLAIYQYNLITCALGFTFSIIFVAKGGTLVLEVTDVKRHINMSFIIAAMQTIVICLFYGSGHILDLVEAELGIKLGWSRPYWALAWNVVAPTLLLWATFSVKHTHDSLDSFGSKAWNMFSCMLAFYPILVVLAFFVFRIQNCQRDGLWRTLQPTRKWCLGLDTSLLVEAENADPEVWQAEPEPEDMATLPPPSPTDLWTGMRGAARRSHLGVPTEASGGSMAPPRRAQEKRKSILEKPTTMAIISHMIKGHKYQPFERQLEEGKRIRRESMRQDV